MESPFEAIADGLATNGYAVVDQFLSQKEVDAIRNASAFSRGLENFRRAHVGKSEARQIQEEIRTDYIQWVDKNTADASILIYLQRLDDLMHYLNRTLFLSLKGYEVHYAMYPEGSYYKRHLDQFRRDDHRKLSVICYLNNGWTDTKGGQLRMYLEDGPIDILPMAGRLVCFRSDQIEHEVLPSKETRLSITGWMKDELVEG